MPLKELTVGLETRGVTVERLTEILGRLITLRVLTFADVGVLTCTCLLNLLIELPVFLKVCVDILVDLCVGATLLETPGLRAGAAGLELTVERLLTGRDETLALRAVELLCGWLLLCGGLLDLPLAFPSAFAKIGSAKIIKIRINKTVAYLTKF